MGSINNMLPYTDELTDILLSGGVAVIPTDTIYGIVGRADLPKTVMRIRELKSRGNDQAFIVLCANPEQVKSFGVAERELEMAIKHWPGKVSIVLPTSKSYPEITGDLTGISFRIPNHPTLQKLLTKTGPLVAPSANPKNSIPALTVEDAKNYYEGSVEIFIDGGTTTSLPSKVIRIHTDGTEEVLRP